MVIRERDAVVQGHVVQVVAGDGLLEVTHAVADGLAQHRQFPGSKDHQHDHHDHDEVPRLQNAYAHVQFLLGATIPASCAHPKRFASQARRGYSRAMTASVGEPPILVDRLTRVFRVHEREEGLLPTLRSVFARRFKEVHAVQDVSFTIDEGAMVGFLVPNGAGKTTTLKMLSGLLHPTRGEARVLGHLPWKRESELLNKITLVMGNRSQ